MAHSYIEFTLSIPTTMHAQICSIVSSDFTKTWLTLEQYRALRLIWKVRLLSFGSSAGSFRSTEP
jgi:hypothetical protein